MSKQAKSMKMCLTKTVNTEDNLKKKIMEKFMGYINLNSKKLGKQKEDLASP